MMDKVLRGIDAELRDYLKNPRKKKFLEQRWFSLV